MSLRTIQAGAHHDHHPLLTPGAGSGTWQLCDPDQLAHLQSGHLAGLVLTPAHCHFPLRHPHQESHHEMLEGGKGFITSPSMEGAAGRVLSGLGSGGQPWPWEAGWGMGWRVALCPGLVLVSVQAPSF